MTRAGLHCAPAAHRSLGTAPHGTVRFSWGNDTTEAEIDIGRRRACARSPTRAAAQRAGEDRRLKWGGVVSFYASEHAMRSERVLERAGLAGAARAGAA